MNWTLRSAPWVFLGILAPWLPAVADDEDLGGGAILHPPVFAPGYGGDHLVGLLRLPCLARRAGRADPRRHDAQAGI
jgi:hypothetical protein